MILRSYVDIDVLNTIRYALFKWTSLAPAQVTLSPEYIIIMSIQADYHTLGIL